MCYVRNNTLIPAPPPLLHGAAAAATSAVTAPPAQPAPGPESFAALLDSAVAHVARKQQQQQSERSASLSSSISTDSHGLPQPSSTQQAAMSLMDELLMDSFSFDDLWLSPTDAGSDAAVAAAAASANPTDFSLFGDASAAVLGDLGLVELAPSKPVQPAQPSVQVQRQMLLQQRAILDSLKNQPSSAAVVSPPRSEEMALDSTPDSFKSDGARLCMPVVGKKRAFDHIKDQDSCDPADPLTTTVPRKSSKKSAKARRKIFAPFLFFPDLNRAK
ncbi:hypothetical protein HDU83_006805 [Entophlyctis luteolus]|nr:hypothetical protein HDU83_006805 [Entophlyctis luteolus]